MRHLRLLLPLVILMAMTASAHAARWSYQTVADGLPSNRILDLTEGSDHVVWAATDRGLARLDASWKTVSPEFFTTLESAADGRVWAGASMNTSSGQLALFAADGNALALPPGLASLTTAPIVDLAAGPGGELWIATRNQNLLRWHDPGGGFVLEEAFPSLATAVDVDAAGRAWWTAMQGPGVWRVWSWTSGSVDFVELNMTGASSLASVLALSDGSAVAGAALASNSPNSVWWMQPGGSALPLPMPAVDPSQPGIVAALSEDARGRVWAGLNDSAYRFDRSPAPEDPSRWSIKSFSGEDGLGGDIVTAILEVEASVGGGVQRQLWIATNLGASILAEFRWANFTVQTGELIGDQCNFDQGSCNTVLSLGFDPDADRVYFGALYGLSRLENGSEWTGWLHNLPPLSNGPLVHPQVNALHVDDDGTVWVATGDLNPTTGGLQTLFDDGRQESWTEIGRATASPRWKISGIGRDADGALWTSGLDGAWRSESDGTVTHYTALQSVPAPATALAIGASAVAVGGLGKVARFDPLSESWTLLDLADAGLPDAVNIAALDLYIDDQYLLIATAVGLVVADADASTLSSATLLDPSVGFAGEVSAITRDADGFFLASTLSGLYRIRPDLSQWVRLGAGNGLPGEDILRVRVRDDEIYLGLRGDGAAAHAFAPPSTEITLAPPTVITSSSLPVTVQVNASDPDSDPAASLFQWRVDELAWSPLMADRNISLVVGALGLNDGAHRIELRAQDAELNLDPSPAIALFEVDTTPPVPVLATPGAGSVLRDIVSIAGKADDARFAKYWVGVWPVGTTIAESDTLQPWTFAPVVGGELASWDTRAFEDDRWVLRVTVEDTLGVAGYTQIEVLVDNVYPFAEQTSPVIALGDLGARVFSSDGLVMVDFPTKSYEGERTLTVERETSSESQGGNAYRVGPEDLELSKRVTLRWILEGALRDASLSIHQRVGDTWVALGGTRQEQAGEVTLVVTVDRLGLFALRDEAASGSTSAIASLTTEPRLLQPRQGPAMSISFELGQSTEVRAVIYSRSGRARRVLADGQQLGPGRQVLLWDGRDSDSEFVAEGLYIVAVEAAGETLKQVVTVGRY